MTSNLHHTLQSLQHILSRSDGDIGSIVLNKRLPHHTSFHDKGVPLGPVVAEQARSVKVLTDGFGERSGVVGQKVDVGGLVTAQLLLPSLDGELVVDGDNVDVRDSFRLELGGVGDVSWDLG